MVLILMAGESANDLVNSEHREHYFRHRVEWLPSECYTEHETTYVHCCASLVTHGPSPARAASHVKRTRGRPVCSRWSDAVTGSSNYAARLITASELPTSTARKV